MIESLRDAAALAALHRVCFDRHWSEDSFAGLLKGAGVHALGNYEGFIVIRCVAGEAESELRRTCLEEDATSNAGADEQ